MDTPTRILSVAVVLALLAFCLTGCLEPTDRLSRRNGDRTAIDDRVAQFRNEGHLAEVARTWTHADGTFAFAQVRLARPGKISTSVAVLEGGSVIDVEVAKQRFSQAHVERWGKMGFQTAEKISSGVINPDEAREFLMFFDAWRTPAEDALLSARRFDPDARLISDPNGVLLRAKPADVLRLAFDPSTSKIIDAEPIFTVRRGVYPYSNAAISSRSDVSYNSQNPPVFGAGIKVGMTEVVANTTLTNGCSLYHQHEAFDHLNSGVEPRVVYQLPRFNPATDSDCAPCGNGSKRLVDGVGPYCVDWQPTGGFSHSTGVASRIAASQRCAPPATCTAGPHHAAKVQLYVGHSHWYSNPTSGLTGLSVSSFKTTHDWFVQNGVKIVNASWGAADFTWKDVLADWYARYKGIVFTQAAGNTAAPGSATVWCNTWNDICVGAADIDGGNVRFTQNPPWTMNDLKMWTGSIVLNPTDGGNLLEWEKPNIAALGAPAHIAKLTPNAPDPTEWQEIGGTSYAAPTVAGVVAMMAEDCWAGDSVAVRTTLALYNSRTHDLDLTPCKTGAGANVSGPLFPTSYYKDGTRVRCDYQAGLGPIDASAFACPTERQAACGGAGQPACPTCDSDDPGADCGGWIATGNLSHDTAGWEDIPADYQNEASWGMDANAHKVYGLRQRASATASWRKMGRWADVRQGTRIRASLAYYSCPGFGPDSVPVVPPLNTPAVPTIGDNDPAVNFDLALCGETKATTSPPSPSVPECVWVSEALLDTNEGFDVVVPKDYAWLELKLITDGLGAGWGCPDPATGVRSERVGAQMTQYFP